jgi:hypothetical protein
MGLPAAIIGSGVLSAGAGLFGANKAASSSDKAAQIAQQQYQTTRGDLSPYNQAGQAVLPQLNALATSGPTGGGPDYVSMAYNNYLPGNMTQAQLEATPGYQFTQQQGLKAVQSNAAARGLGVSGAALKGAAAFATGLADNTYKDQFNIQQQRFSDVANLSPLQQAQLTGQYNRLSGLASIGEGAAAQTGTAGVYAANTAAGQTSAAGTAQGAGIQGIGSAATSGVNSYLGYQALQKYLNPVQTTPAAASTSGYVPNPTAAAAQGNALLSQPTY